MAPPSTGSGEGALDKARADLAELKLAEERGQLVRTDQSRKPGVPSPQPSGRASWRSPSTAAPLISGKATPSENEAMLRQLVDDALGDLSGAEITFKDEPEDIPAGERV